tara:strand:- start:108 stop:602 length:495 start_codon:yes stop_codon:yes gene_type:complete
MKKFDPFSYENLFYEYNLKISTDEVNQVLFLLKKNLCSSEQLTTYSSLNVLNFPLLKNLRKQIIDILDKHNLLLRHNWSQLYNKENKHSIHNHYGSTYSGIIYIKGKDPSPTVFYSNRNLDKYSHKFKENTLIMFPSTIIHEVERLDKDEERLIISFNAEKNMK